ncbi:MAG TPA: hypothetical protein VFQ85_14870 [Mycobacteriales bacterium]|jgi:hypothetical protein|nr:hypothetical protein [Mycobacteriales bacterium]
MKRTLTLKRETLAELTADELTGVGGGQQAITVQGFTCPLVSCLISCPTTNF